MRRFKKKGKVLDVGFGIDITVGGPEKFDVIKMWHSLEHVDNPVRYLQHVRHWLKKGCRACLKYDEQ